MDWRSKTKFDVYFFSSLKTEAEGRIQTRTSKEVMFPEKLCPIKWHHTWCDQLSNFRHLHHWLSCFGPVLDQLILNGMKKWPTQAKFHFISGLRRVVGLLDFFLFHMMDSYYVKDGHNDDETNYSLTSYFYPYHNHLVIIQKWFLLCVNIKALSDTVRNLSISSILYNEAQKNTK